MPAVTPIALATLLLTLLTLQFRPAAAARATFSVHYPWPTRQDPPPHRSGLDPYIPFCGDFQRNPQQFAAHHPTFVSFSGNAGDLVSVRYTRSRVPRSAADFPHSIATDVPIAPSGQLCFDVQVPTPHRVPEYGVLLFEARDPVSGEQVYSCSDVKLVEIEELGADHPAMCARGNETLIPMPDEFL